MQSESGPGQDVAVSSAAAGATRGTPPGGRLGRSSGGLQTFLRWPGRRNRARDGALKGILATLSWRLGCAAVVIAVGTGLALSLVDIDRLVNRHKDWIVGKLERATDLAIRVDGDITVGLGRVAVIRLADVHLAAETGEAPPVAAFARQVEVDVATLPLLRGELKFDRISFTDADIRLGFDPTDPASLPAAAITAGGAAGDPDMSIALRDVNLRDTAVTWQDAETGETQRLWLDRAELTTDTASTPLWLDLTGRWQDRPLSVAGEVGSIAGLLADRPVPVALQGYVANLAFRVKGTFDQPPARRAFTGDLQVEGASLADVALWAGVSGAPDSPFRISAKVRREAGKLTLDAVAGTVADSPLSGTIAIDARGARPRVDGTLQIARLDLQRWASAWRPDASGPAAGAGQQVSGRPDPLAGLGDVDLRLQLQVGSVRAPGADLTDVDVGLRMDESGLSLAPLRAHVFGSPLHAEFALQAGADAPSLTLRLSAPSLNLQQLARAAGTAGRLQGSAELVADLTSHGGSYAAMMANFSGDLRVNLRDATLTWQDGDTGETRSVSLDRAKFATKSASAPIKLDLTGRGWDRPLSVKGEIGSIAALLTKRPVPAALLGRVADVEFQLDGTAGPTQAPLAFAGDIRVEGASLAALARQAGISGAPDSPFKITAKARHKAGELVLDAVAGTVANSALSGHVAVDRRGSRPRIEGTLRITRLDLRDWSAAWLSGTDRPPARGDRLFSDRPLPLAMTGTADLQLRLLVDSVRMPGAELTDLDVGLRMDDGGIDLAPLRAHLFGSPLHAAFALRTVAGAPSLALRVAAPSFDLRRATRGAGKASALGGTAELVVDLTSRGQSFAAIMANLDGKLRLAVRDLRDPSGSIDWFNREFGQIFDVLLGSGAAVADLDCIGSEVHIRDGQAEGWAAASRSGDVVLAGEGRMDLGAEQVEARVSPQVTLATLHGARPIKLSGSFADLQFHPSLNMHDRLKRRDSVCEKRNWSTEAVIAMSVIGDGTVLPSVDNAQIEPNTALTADVQRELAALGYDPGPIDGIVGPRTREAVRQFLADHRQRVVQARVSIALLSSLRAARAQGGNS